MTHPMPGPMFPPVRPNPPRPPSPWNRTAVLITAIVAGAVMLLCGGLILLGLVLPESTSTSSRSADITATATTEATADGTPEATEPATPSPSPSTSTPTPTPTAAAPATVDPAAAMSAWYHGGGADHITAIGADMDAFAAAGGAGDLAGARSSCVSLRADVTAAEAYAPMPDAAAQREWVALLDADGRAAGHCVDGIDRSSAALIGQSTRELDEGTAHTRALTARIGEIGGRATY